MGPLISKVLFVFLDGVGIGPDDPALNPFLGADLPALRHVCGSIPHWDDPAPRTDRGACLPLDATLGVDGRPQSGTGQTALFTGLNAAEIFGRHFGPWTPVALRPVLSEHNLLRTSTDRGAEVAFANAYPRGYPEGVSTRRQAAPPLSALSIGALTRHHEALLEGDAVASGIENTGWRRHLGHTELPVISAETAGANLARIARTADLTVFAHYDTDYAGHEGSLSVGVKALERVDRFLSGVIEHLDRDTLLLVASDHGNIEETTGKHTRNDVMGLVYAEAGLPDELLGLRSIMDVASTVADLVGKR